jgi:hypothetical protein
MTAGTTTVEYNPFDAEFYTADPFAVYRWMRDEAPVYRSERWGWWALTRFEDVRAAITDPDTFRSFEGMDIDDTALEQAPPGSLPNMDNPRHGQVREVVQPYLLPRRPAGGGDPLGGPRPDRLVARTSPGRPGRGTGLADAVRRVLPPGGPAGQARGEPRAGCAARAVGALDPRAQGPRARHPPCDRGGQGRHRGHAAVPRRPDRRRRPHKDAPILVAIETGRGLLLACLPATGRKVFAINSMAVSRNRDRHSVARSPATRSLYTAPIEFLSKPGPPNALSTVHARETGLRVTNGACYADRHLPERHPFKEPSAARGHDSQPTCTSTRLIKWFGFALSSRKAAGAGP